MKLIHSEDISQSMSSYVEGALRRKGLREKSFPELGVFATWRE